jgi:hypothetical protein
MDLVPVFEAQTRKYQITLYNDDKSVLVTAAIGYDHYIGDFFEAELKKHPEYIKAFYNYKPYTNEGNPDFRWSFKGWKTNLENIKIIPYLKDVKVAGDMAFYAHYKEENVHENVTMVERSDDYFKIEGTTISLKPQFLGVLEGKITLPSTNPKTKEKLTTIGDFSDYEIGNGGVSTTKFTHIYFMSDAQYTTINGHSF